MIQRGDIVRLTDERGNLVAEGQVKYIATEEPYIIINEVGYDLATECGVLKIEIMKHKNRSDYTYEFKDGVLRIIDLKMGRMSVTNNIENVVKDIFQDQEQTEPPADIMIIYRDSEGYWDGWDAKHGFIFLGSETAEDAIKRYNHKKQIKNETAPSNK